MRYNALITKLTIKYMSQNLNQIMKECLAHIKIVVNVLEEKIQAYKNVTRS